MNERYLLIFLRLVGLTALLAFGAALMPERWMIEIAEELGIKSFPEHPLTFYLARNLSLLYGYVGAVMLLVASDLARYRPLVSWMAKGTISFGVLQLIVDAMSGLPTWWTLGEGTSTLIGGVMLWWLDRRTPSSGP
ncbi:hypothetical protein [Neorhodopirellula pilleata]|uniref:Uncharacterized protein n=1 Tax=Neorhodopirellula pilleata TaxID=2714738 RepID=A0A5C6AVX1_9BACT|nr:hypothetical protein [Neorhodopirellula pilleata]TWU03758.1 hypothetical protein Pla100_06880 [Neorhodopirellula pilleata]